MKAYMKEYCASHQRGWEKGENDGILGLTPQYTPEDYGAYAEGYLKGYDCGVKTRKVYLEMKAETNERD